MDNNKQPACDKNIRINSTTEICLQNCHRCSYKSDEIMQARPHSNPNARSL